MHRSAPSPRNCRTTTFPITTLPLCQLTYGSRIFQDKQKPWGDRDFQIQPRLLLKHCLNRRWRWSIALRPDSLLYPCLSMTEISNWATSIVCMLQLRDSSSGSYRFADLYTTNSNIHQTGRIYLENQPGTSQMSDALTNVDTKWAPFSTLAVADTHSINCYHSLPDGIPLTVLYNIGHWWVKEKL